MSDMIKEEKFGLMPTYNRFNVEIVRGFGATAVDVNGKEYIDFGAGIGVNSLGYCDPGWVEAISKQASLLQHTSNLYNLTIQRELGTLLCSKTGYDSLFLCNSGAEANECAIKVARKYSNTKYDNKRNKIISLVNSFHGRTITTLSATGQDEYHVDFFPFTPGFVHVPAEDVEALLEAMDDQVCAVMMEPIQGEGGVKPLSSEYIEKVASICHSRDVLLIFDEIQTGVARTGKLYAYEHTNVKPDILTSAKGLGGGLPIGACLVREGLSEVMTYGTHGSTFGGNPIACAGAIYVVNKVSDKSFLENVALTGSKISKTLLEFPNVKSTRGQGMMIGVEPINGTSREIAVSCLEKGLFVLTAKNMIRLLPPLNITKNELEKGLEIFKTVMQGFIG